MPKTAKLITPALPHSQPAQRRCGSACRVWIAAPLGLLFCVALTAAALADEFDEEPIRYSASPGDNAVTKLQTKLELGQVQMQYEKHFGYLRSVLKELGVSPESQMLVFSKTSLQRQRIAPRTPRAIYFGDDVYVGFCQNGEVMELSAVDPQLGAVFYTLDQTAAEKPRIARQSDSCLICHGSSVTQGVPGHLVRSVYPDGSGLPILSSGSHRIDHSSPLQNRWGGWYVTGTHGAQTHLGNLIVRGRERPESLDNAAGMNVTDLAERFKTSNYLTPHSDIVALMVLEHQAEAHNRLARANFQTRQAIYHAAALNRDLGYAADHQWDSTASRIRSACEPLVNYLLMCNEAPLTAKIAGTSKFAAEFAAQGPRDPHGRSLRELDLERRLFKYPCSYLIYSPSYAGLPAEARQYVERRLWEVLAAPQVAKDFAHLCDADRQAIREILVATKPDLPDYWRAAAAE